MKPRGPETGPRMIRPGKSLDLCGADNHILPENPTANTEESSSVHDSQSSYTPLLDESKNDSGSPRAAGALHASYDPRPSIDPGDASTGPPPKNQRPPDNRVHCESDTVIARLQTWCSPADVLH